jgi:hypothetical protein
VLRKHVGAIRDISVAKTKTGLGGTAGNKGGVLLRFIYYNTSLCFVCSHFAAHQKEIRQRNEDFRQIYEQSTFTSSLAGGSSSKAPKLQPRHHDYVFWCGDLNYRIDMPNDRCRALIAECKWDQLLELDQLMIQHRERNVFREFHEAPISFPPTYKYNVLEDTYDRSEKCRVPAWTGKQQLFRAAWIKKEKNLKFLFLLQHRSNSVATQRTFQREGDGQCGQVSVLRSHGHALFRSQAGVGLV